MVKAKFDATADAAYYQIADEGGSVAATDEIDPGTFVDLDVDGNVVGIEVLGLQRQWPVDEILARYSLNDEDRAMLAALGSASSQEIAVPASSGSVPTMRAPVHAA